MGVIRGLSQSLVMRFGVAMLVTIAPSLVSAGSATALGQSHRPPELILQNDVGADFGTLVFSPDERVAVSVRGGGSSIKIWDVAAGSPLRTIENGPSPLVYIAFGPNPGTLVSVDFGGSMKVWDLATARELRSVATKKLSTSMMTGPNETT